MLLFGLFGRRGIKRFLLCGTITPLEIIDEIKVLSWKWCLARLKVAPNMFYEWTWDPGDCLMC
jgi:hypothetical protein